MEELETGVFQSGWVQWSAKQVKRSKTQRKGEIRSQEKDDGSNREARERVHGKTVKNEERREKSTFHFIS